MQSSKAGYIFHIKDDYFKIAQDDKLMRNYEGGALRPTYYCVKDDKLELLWMIPMSRKTEKYKAIAEKDIARYGKCSKIYFAKVAGKEAVFLIQDAFPAIEKHISHAHIIRSNPVFLEPRIQANIKSMFNEARNMYERGIKVIFPDIIRLEKLMLEELQSQTKKQQ